SGGTSEAREGRSRTWPIEASTTKSLPRNLAMVLAFAGDSTITSGLRISPNGTRCAASLSRRNFGGPPLPGYARTRMSDPVPILHRDARLLVVDKPAGVLSVPELPELLARAGITALPVHRLDRDVSGALLLALDEDT